MTTTIKTLIKSAVSNVFRRASIKRRSLITGAFESSWFEITDDVKTFGKITNQIDSARRYKFTFGTAKLTMENDEGRYNPHDDSSSLWYGYLNQQRTLVKLDIGFLDANKNDNGVWVRSEYPSSPGWDEAVWDDGAALWDSSGGSSTVFVGVISGDIPLSDKNEVVLNVRPLSSVFQDFPAQNLTGWTTTGRTASQYAAMLRDQTDGSGNFIFRPFFGDTTTNWDISTTSTVFTNLNTSTAEDVIDKTAWEVLEKLAEAENFVPYITRTGVFKFVSRSSVDTVSAFQFHGAGSFNTEYGQTIKTVANYGFKVSKYYSRVQIKWKSEDTSTSYEVYESTLTVSASNNPWILGAKTLAIENFYIPTSTVANTLAQTIFNDTSALKKEIEFTTSLVPHLDLFDRFSIYYDPASFLQGSLWDQNDWAADVTTTAADLIWDAAGGDAIALSGTEFKFLTFEIDLDNMQNKFIAREV